MKYLKDIKNTLKGLIPFSNFSSDDKSSKIQLEDIDDLKDLFTEFCDQFEFEFREINPSGFSNMRDYREIINKIYSMYDYLNNKNDLVYTRMIFNDSKYGDYVFFSMCISRDRPATELKDIVNLTDDIYEKINQ